MDINLLRAISTILLSIAFICICVMVFSRKRKDYYEEASKIPLREKPVEQVDQQDAIMEAGQ